jgi:hypothetical protein
MNSQGPLTKQKFRVLPTSHQKSGEPEIVC